MQDVTPWPASFDVSEPVARVVVDGREVEVDSVTVTSELDTAMPGRVAAGGGGVVAATGTASILPRADIAEAGFNPWGDAQQFVNASEIVVEAGYRDPETGGVGCARQITAQVESLGGGALAHGVNMEYVDYTPLLDRDITIEPLLWRYPLVGSDGPPRKAGLNSIYVRDRVLRHCGFFATPPMISQALLSAPLMGSAVPERGTFVSGQSDNTEFALFRPVSWGVGFANGTFRFAPNLGSRGHARLTSTLHLSFLREQSTHESPSTVTFELRWGSAGNAIRVQAFANGNLSVRYVQGGSATLVATLPAADVNASEGFTVLVTPSGQTTIHASNGATATGTASLPSVLTSQSLDEIYVRAPVGAHPVAGLQVAFSASTINNFDRTAHLDPPVHMRYMDAFPFHHHVNCLDLLKDQSQAELAAMWIDEYGHFRWRNRVRLRNTTPVGTLTSKDDLLGLSWETPVRSVFSRVEVQRDIPHITWRAEPSITVSDSRGSTLSGGDTEDRFFEPPADQDWHMVDAPQWMGGTVNYNQLKRGRGSYRGGIVVDDDDDERLAYSSQLSQSWSQINEQRWLLSSSVQGLRATEFIEQSHRDRPDLYGKFAGENLPIIRAQGLVEWDTDTVVGSARGPRFAPVFTHQAGPWAPGLAEARDLADWLADQLTKPEPVLRNVQIVPDPRVQLGDVFWLEDQTAYHVRLRVVVMGKTLRYQMSSSGPEMTQEITFRVISVRRQGVRYDELEAAWQGQDYAALEAAWSGRDYADFEADPLEGS